jgi:hypothetical protein
MSEEGRDDAIARRARQVLDRRAEELDETERARLRAARLRALDALAERRPLAIRRGLAAAGVGALGLMLVTSWWIRQPGPDLGAADGLEDLDILAAADDLELYDDLDFYRWLADSEAI